MEQTKVHYHGETVISEQPQHPAPPPPYSSNPSSSYGPPHPGPQQAAQVYTSVSMVHAPMGVVHAPMGVVHAPMGVMHAPVGVVGTQVGVVGTQVGVVGVGRGTVPVLIGQQISPKPTRMTCKSCNFEITTKVVGKPSWKTHFFAGLLCLIGCWCCVCIPYCSDSCLNNDHYCPNCNAYIASYVT